MEGIQLSLFDFSEADRQEREEARTRAEVFEDYDGFTEKFKPKKTTDDCYTPEPVYEAVMAFVGTLVDMTGREVVRPFWPGGDYQKYPYPENCIVIDNPPFSIYAQIVRWYLSRGIDFFLFGPQLTLFVRNADVTYFIANTQITYENGAVVNTSFVTNLTPGYRIWLCPELKAAVDACAPAPKLIAKNTYPDTVVTSAILGKIIARGVELKIPSSECQYVGTLDALQRAGKSLYGGGYLLSRRAAAERAAAERAAAEARLGTQIQLSQSEQAIVERLSR